MVTEKRNSKSKDIDSLDTKSILEIINKEDQKVPIIIKEVLDSIALVVDKVVEVIKNNGRLIYIGAGTSGRLGVLDASECPPTFGTDPNLVIGLIAGGDTALRNAIEGAEDNIHLAKDDLININFSNKDILIGIAASGRTPYVIGGLKYARELGAKCVSISCNKDSEMKKHSDYDITAEVGAEVVTGSTRMKAGTSQKLILNMITTSTMIKLGKVYGNLMVDVKASNEKLRKRQINIVIEATGVEEIEAQKALKLAKENCKLAIFYILSGLDIIKAKEVLDSHNGYIREAIKEIQKL